MKMDGDGDAEGWLHIFFGFVKHRAVWSDHSYVTAGKQAQAIPVTG
jgi:hypothetical protein